MSYPADPSLMVVVGVMTAYETSMYLFVFLYVSPFALTCA